MTSPEAAALRVVDLATGMSAALVSTLFADGGAVVHRVAPPGDEIFDQIYPAHRGWRSVTIPADADDLDGLLEQADVCLVGGEDHPAVATRRDAQDLAARYPRLVVVHLTGYVDGYAPEAPAVDLLVQARTGLVAEQFSDRPMYFAVPFPTYGQTVLAALGAWAALLDRVDTGRGQVVTASLQQGAAMFMMPFWMQAERPDGEFHKVTPKDVRHLNFQCADGTYVQFVMGVPAAVAKLYQILGIDEPVDPSDRGIPRIGASPDTYFGNRPLIAPYVARMNRDDILAAAAEVGLPAAPVLELGEFWDDEQLAANRLLVDRGGATGVGNVIGVSGTVPVPETERKERTAGAPLAGVTVLDFGSYVAGPFVSRLLADLGASVIKVESLTGDPNRGLQRHFLAAHVGKRALAVDAKSPAGAEVLRRLLTRADVVLHNFRPKAAERLGVDPEAVRAVKPDAVTLQSLAFGPSGPRADAPGFDMVIQALIGLLRRAGGPGQPPLWIRTPYLDYAGGALGAIAVLMSLYERRTAGRVSDRWVSLLNAGMFLLSDLQRMADGTMRGAPELDADRLGVHPGERLYRTDDGWIAVVARTDQAARAMWQVLLPGEEPLPRADWDDAVAARFSEQASRRQTEELLAALGKVGVWAERCRTDGLAELLGNPAAADAHLLVDRLDDRYGRLTGCFGPLVNFSRTRIPVTDQPGAPGFGAHTRQILTEIGYTDAEIEDLFRAGVVR